MKRKGFTLVELLIVVAIIGVLASMMTLSAGSSTATARAATIYNNIHSIKMAGLMYKMQEGDAFSEKNVTGANFKTAQLLDMDTYNTTNGSPNNIQYKIVAGTEAKAAVPDSDPDDGEDDSEAAVPAKGAYVICSFNSDTDKVAIAKALRGYKDIRINGDDDGETDYTVGAFFYHTTKSEKDEDEDYDTDFAF